MTVVNVLTFLHVLTVLYQGRRARAEGEGALVALPALGPLPGSGPDCLIHLYNDCLIHVK